MDKITVVCHKDHVVSYEDYRGRCLLCLVEDLMQEVGRLTAICKEKEWVGLTDEEIETIVNNNTYDDSGYDIWCHGKGIARDIEAGLKEKNCG